MKSEERRVVASAVASAVKPYLSAHERSITWLAHRTGMAVSSLHNKMNARRDFTVTELAEIAAVLGVTPSQLVPPLQGHESDAGQSLPRDPR